MPEIKDLVLQKPRFNALVKKLRVLSAKADARETIQLKGLRGSSAATFLAPLKNALPGIYLFVLDDEEEAGYFYHDICQIAGDANVSFFPSGYKRSIKYGQADSANEILRTETLSTLAAMKEAVGADGTLANAPTEPSQRTIAIVTYPEALAEKVATSEQVTDSVLQLHKGERVDSQFVVEMLANSGFQRVDYVYEPGQFAVRGSIIDVFSFSSEYPFRIDFFGNEIDSLRSFEVDSQLSREQLDEIMLSPSFAAQETQGISLAEFLPQGSVVICNDPTWVCDRVEEISGQQLSEQLIKSEEGDVNALQKLVSANAFRAAFEAFPCILMSDREPSAKKDKSLSIIEFHTTPQPEWHKNFDLIANDFRRYQEQGYTLHILSDSPKQLDRIEAIFDDRGDRFHLVRIPRAIHAGFVDDDTKNCYFTDHQIFDRYHRYNLRSDRARSGKIALSIKELK
ncbi:MAG: transcription-repair coupling factor, partial [Bacteroidales bacterium]|nr:transcription-repair coupling factor [Bacteroidales bacterium]